MTRLHFTLHKCLTTYYIRVMSALYNRLRPGVPRFKHYESLQAEFYANLHRHRVLSASGFTVDISRLPEEFRLVRFVRDPRDLIVSGYFYHRRGAEPWFRTISPTETYWSPINGHVPEAMPTGVSFAQYLQGLTLEQGLLAEMEFRRYHLESLRRWPADERIRLFKYEQILGNERAVFDEIFSFYELTRFERLAGVWLADRYSTRRRSGDRHVRDPRPGQWRQYFTPPVTQEFERRYDDLLDLLEYRV